MNKKSRYLKWIRKNSIKGFTLVELLVVLAVIAVLASGVIYTTIGQADKAKDAKTLSSIKEIKNGLDLYYQDTDCYPTNDNFLSGTSWKVTNNGKETVYIAKMPTGASSFEYKTDTVSACPQWGIVYAPLLKSQTNSVCKIPSYVANEPSCVPPQYSSSWGCVILGKIQCGTAPAPVPTTIIPAPTSTNPVPTPTPQTGGTTNLVEDSDHDGYYIGGASPQVVDSTPSSYNGRQYYRKKDGSTGYIYISPTATGMLGGGDCNDSNASLFTNLSSSVTDADHDGYYVGSTSLTNCVGLSAAFPMTGGLVGSYPMNDGSGTTVADSSGFGNNAKFNSMYGLIGWWKLAGSADSSGNNLNVSYGTGTASTGPMYGANSSSALTFNGTSDYFVVNNNALLNPTRQITVSGWYKVNGMYKAWQSLFWKGDPDCTGTNCSSRQYALWLTSAGQLYATATSQNNISVGQSSCWGIAGSITVGQWYYISLVINSDTGVMQIYVNGQLQNSSGQAACDSFSTSGIRTTTGGFHVGANPSWDSFLNGTVADVKIYNRALSASELQMAYSTTANGLVGYWQLDESRDKVVYDSSGNGTGGQFNNGLRGYWKFKEGGGNVSYDQSGYGVNATINNTTYANFNNGTIYFDGSANAYATTGALDVSLAGDNPWTISTWAYTATEVPGGGQWRSLMTIGNCTAGPRAPIIYRVPGAYVGGFYNGAVVGAAATANAWNQITVTYTGSQGLVSVYLNGAFIGSASAAGAPGTMDGQMVNFARDGINCGSWGNWNGYMTQPQLYNKALSAAEVLRLYSSSNYAWDQPGRIGAATGSFNTGTAVNSGTYVSLGTGSALNVPGAMSAFMWVKPRDVNAFAAVFGQVDGAGNGGNFNFNIGQRYAGQPGRVEANWGGVINTSNTALSNNQWYHVGFVRSGSSGNWTGKIYINGVLDKTFTNNTNPQAQLSTYIGGLGAGFPTYSFNGNIDDVQLYNRALTQTEITAMYNNSGSPFWTTDRNGVANSALYFNGKTGFTSPGSPAVLNTTGNMSISGWVNSTGSSINQSIATWANGAFSTFPYHFVLVGGTNQLRLNDGTTTTDSAMAIPINSWTHVAMTINSNQLRYYINGIPDVANPRTINTRSAGNGYLTFSREASGLQSFAGAIDDLKFYNRTLSAGEVGELYTTSISGKIAQWKMDEASGTTIKDSVGTANGIIGSMNSFQSGKIGNALYNPGSSAGATIPAPQGSVLDLISTSTPTISFWLKVNSLATPSRLINQIGQNGLNLSYDQAGNLFFGTFGGTVVYPGMGAVTADNTWHHYAIAYNGSTVTLYKDGVQFGSPLSLAVQWAPDSIPLTIGGDVSYPLRGWIDEVQIYNRPLSASEVSVLASQLNDPSGQFDSSPGEIANWKLDEASGTTIQDSVGGFTGTIGSANSFQAGKYGNSLANPGTSAGATVPVAAGSALDFTSASRPTISFWLKPTTLANASRFIERIGTGGWGVEYYVDGSVALIAFGVNVVQWQPGVVVVDNNWHHYAITYNGSTASLYKDGVLVSTQPYAAGWSSSNQALNIGGDVSYPLRGNVDEIKIYNRPLTASEISVLATQSPGGGLTKLYYKNSSGNYNFVKQSEALGPNDPDDNDPKVW